MREHEQSATEFIQAIKTLAARPEQLNNLQHYLSIHFLEWLKRWASTPEDITAELKQFAEMEI